MCPRHAAARGRRYRLVIGPAVTEVTKFKVKEPARVDIPRGGVHQVYKQCLSVRAAEGCGSFRHAKGTILRPVHAVSSGEIPLTGGFLWVIEECACDLARSKPKTLIFGHLGLDGFDAHKVGHLASGGFTSADRPLPEEPGRSQHYFHVDIVWVVLL